MVLVIGDEDVLKLMNMKEAIDVVEEAFKQQGLGSTRMPPRIHVTFGDRPGYLRVMPAAIPTMGYAGLKAYTPLKKAGFRFTVLLYDIRSGELVGVMNANRLGQIRTGAASGVATKFLSRKDSETIGIFGTGYQAESQLQAICTVRKIASIKAYSPNPQHRTSFAERMTQLLNMEVIAVESPEQVVRSSDIIVTATNSKVPVLEGSWLDEGTHVNAIGANFPTHRELDDVAVRRSKIVVDDLQQARLEAGDIIIPVKSGVISEDRIYAELGEIVVGKKQTRIEYNEITLFKSVGIGIQDVALASKLYEKAVQLGEGKEISL